VHPRQSKCVIPYPDYLPRCLSSLLLPTYCWPPPSQHKLLLPWNAGSGDDAFSLAPFPSTRLWLVCRRTIGRMLYPFVRGAAFKESLSRVFSYYNPYIAEYFRWLHWHSLAIFWLCPLILMHELYLFSNDFIYPGEQVDDYDNKVTIVLSMLLVLWSVLLSNKLHRPENGRIQQSHRLKWPPLTSFRSAVALGVTVVFLFIGYKANEARVVYVVYDCDHKGLEGSSARSLGLSFEPSNFRIYKCLIEVRMPRALSQCRMRTQHSHMFCIASLVILFTGHLIQRLGLE
jgi:hypothetical protein